MTKQTPQPVLDAVKSFPANIFTAIEESDSVYLMRGPICFGEVRGHEDRWRAWGYGYETFLGVFSTPADALRAVSSAAWKTLEEAGLALVSGE